MLILASEEGGFAPQLVLALAAAVFAAVLTHVYDLWKGARHRKQLRESLRSEVQHLQQHIKGRMENITQAIAKLRNNQVLLGFNPRRPDYIYRTFMTELAPELGIHHTMRLHTAYEAARIADTLMETQEERLSLLESFDVSTRFGALRIPLEELLPFLESCCKLLDDFLSNSTAPFDVFKPANPAK